MVQVLVKLTCRIDGVDDVLERPEDDVAIRCRKERQAQARGASPLDSPPSIHPLPRHAPIYTTALATAPPTSAMDVLPGVPECVETHAGDTLASRLFQIPALRLDRPSAERWGPHDVVVFEKQRGSSNPLSWFGSAEVLGYVHFPRGADVSTAAAIGAYLYDLASQQPQSSWLSGSVFKIIKGTFAVYCCFSKVDLRVEMKLPGGIRSYVVDAAGTVGDATDDLFHEAVLCSAIRAHLTEVGSQACVRYVPYPVKWVDLVKDCPALQPAVMAVYDYLKSMHRSEDANAILRLAKADPVSAVAPGEVAASAPSSSSFAESVASPGAAALSEGLGRLKLSLGNLLEKPRQRIRQNPADCDGWIELAKAYLGLKSYDMALIALNLCPPELEDRIPEDVAPERWEAVKNGGIASVSYASRTTPSPGPAPVPAWFYEQYMFRLDDIRSVSRELHPNAVHDGAMDLLDSEDEDASTSGPFLVDKELRSNPSRILKEQTSSRKVYDVLSFIYKKVGWDELLRIRASVFYMEGEELEAKQRHERAATIKSFVADILRRVTEHNASPARQQAAGDVVEESTLDIADATMPVSLHAGGVPQPDDRSLVMGQASYAIPVSSTGGVGSGAAAAAASSVSSAASSDNGEDADDGDNVCDTVLKRLCSPFLDSIFQMLYLDLRAFAGWKTEEAQIRKANPDRMESYELLPRRASVEWFLRGQIAERLGHAADAEMAYRMAIYMSWHLRSYLALLRMYSDRGLLRESLIIADQILKYYTPELSAFPRVVEEDIHPGVRKAFYSLVSHNGLGQVQDCLEREIHQAHPFFSTLVMCAIRHHVDGFDRR